ncbi:MAG: RnfABCDGE type electron transport complex subunit D [Patescibacteria group bacterium]|nr:RnfABCDGE type electron transport complex subunit D [Patescibacteria group bacterium]
MIQKIDTYLNNITMYKITVYALCAIALLSIAYGFLGILPLNAISLIVSLSVIIITCYISNKICQKISNLPTNNDSWLISALILFLIIAPPDNYQSDILITIIASTIAILSKYIFKLKNSHIFNPVAIALLTIGIFGFGNSIWWVGSASLAIPVAILGFLVVKKIRQSGMVFAFFITTLATSSLFSLKNNIDIVKSIYEVVISWPTIFLGTIMLTEPSTMPATNLQRKIYGAVVGFLFSFQFSFGPIFSSPELAIVIGNVFSCLISPKQKTILAFKTKLKIARNTYEFVFEPDKKLTFLPGQYLELTLNTTTNDTRGNRRYFTIASSPTDTKVRFGIKFADAKGSSFKDTIFNLRANDKVLAGNLGGDFVMPKDINKPLVFIAGGIGITPFISMIRYLTNVKEKRPITLFYANNTINDIAYKNVLDQANKKLGLKTIYLLTNKDLVSPNWKGEVGYLNEEIIKKYLKNHKEQTYYLSGPSAMVDSYKNLLAKIGIPNKQIKTDYFPGF